MQKSHITSLYGAELGFTIAKLSHQHTGLVVVITKDIATANYLQQELAVFTSQANQPIVNLPDWETLPYDQFSPHQDIISERLATLYRLPNLQKGILVLAANTFMQYLPPREFLEANSLVLKNGDALNIEAFRNRLEKYGYRSVTQVMEHGEFAIRGSLLDIFPMGNNEPYRIDLFDDLVDSIRVFDPETQLSTTKIGHINLLPAKEFPLTDEAITHFRHEWRTVFSGDPSLAATYQSVSRRESAPGIEYYLSLFFDSPATLGDYLPVNSLIITLDDIHAAAENFWQEIKHRHEELSHDQYHPILPPSKVFLTVDKLHSILAGFQQVSITTKPNSPLPNLLVDHKQENPLLKLKLFLHDIQNANSMLGLAQIDSSSLDLPLGDDESSLRSVLDIHDSSERGSQQRGKPKCEEYRVLFSAESLGRRESLLALLKKHLNLEPALINNWQEFCDSQAKFGILVSELACGTCLEVNKQNIIFIITENELFGTPAFQKPPTKQKPIDLETTLRSLTELTPGDPIVHIEHGVGRYLGLQNLKTDNQESEFLVIEYANHTKLYVPVAALHLVSRYSGVSTEHAPLNHLGTKTWDKVKHEAIKKARDVAVELLNIFAKRASRTGFCFTKPDQNYAKFTAAFPFEETPDQRNAILATINDMASTRLMDRLICGDVGFGKTEVAMRAAFIAVASGKQVAILVPTTLLAEQHYQNFLDRFADWPVAIEMLSRFRSTTQQTVIIEKLKEGKIDIIIGTHKLLQPTIIFKDLGLLIIDEEHRFGVKAKERLKELRPEVDILTLTATPIPRTLNMALSGMRDFSIIATPPPGRMAIKTFIQEKNNHLVREAILREIMRGGQVYFLHNEVININRIADELTKLVPEARISVAHGQMRERELEQVMTDFYHKRFNILVCTTIIESGIDIPNANTIIINRADKLGLAELHQLRGRVGRSHHQAYAYLITPPYKLLSGDAKKRLDALASLGNLGIGFALAAHDLEIRGAGELLGEEQSGQIEAIGFDLYVEYLEKALAALKNGTEIDLDKDPLQETTEVDLQIPALIPDTYLHDINIRLILYKRIANAKNETELDALQVEMIDRFGLLPSQAKNLFGNTEIKLLAAPLGIKKIIANLNQGSIEFIANPKVDAKKIIALVQKHPQRYKLKGSSKLEFFQKHVLPPDLIEFIKRLLHYLH